MTWFRVECGAADDRLFDQLGEALGISTGEAFYHYFAFTGRLAAEDTSGNMRALLDRTVEKWAKWVGTPGGFARVLRGLCEDTDTGELRGFRSRNEKLLERQAKDRKKRKISSPPVDRIRNPPETPEGFSGVPAENPRANGNGNRTTTTATAGALVIGTPKHLAIADHMTQDRYRSALDGYLRAAHDPPRLLEQFTLTVDGLAGPGGRPVSPDQLGAALNAMAIAGTKCTEKILAAFVLREVEPDKPNGNGKHRTDAKTQGTLDAMERFKRKHGVPAHA